MTVEVDEAKFGKRKFNRGRRVPGQWIVGGVCRETKEYFFVLVDKRPKSILHQICKDFINMGSTIYTDCWKGYIGLDALGFTHKTVNNYQFILKLLKQLGEH
jgi:transposase-like protein